MWPVQIPVPGSSVCHRLDRPQAHPFPEKLPRPEESVRCEQACGGPTRAVDHATACGGLHNPECSPAANTTPAWFVAPSTTNTRRNTRPPPTETCPTSRGRPRSGAPRATRTSVSVSAAHAGVTITLKFSFGVEPSPE